MAGSGPIGAGAEAPDFSLPATGGTTVSLRDFRGKKHVLLAFYILDWTPT